MSPQKRTPYYIQLPMFDALEITLTKGHKTIIDTIDSDLAEYHWHASGAEDAPYAANWLDYKLRRLHRIILERIIGRPLEPKEEVDHINGNTLDNRRENLRPATRLQNGQYRKRPKNNTSGYKGVGYLKAIKRYGATIKVNGKSIYLGSYPTAEEAYAAYCEAAKKYHGEFARLE